jgi:hypothetical protein
MANYFSAGLVECFLPVAAHLNPYFIKEIFGGHPKRKLAVNKGEYLTRSFGSRYALVNFKQTQSITKRSFSATT